MLSLSDARMLRNSPLSPRRKKKTLNARDLRPLGWPYIKNQHDYDVSHLRYLLEIIKVVFFRLKRKRIIQVCHQGKVKKQLSDVI